MRNHLTNRRAQRRDDGLTREPGQEFAKPVRSVEELYLIMQARGVVFDPASEEYDKHCILSLGYFRIAGYLKPDRVENSDKFAAGTQFKTVMERHEFDRCLRRIMFEAIEMIELNLRSCLCQVLGEEGGSHWYLRPSKHVPTDDDEVADTLAQGEPIPRDTPKWRNDRLLLNEDRSGYNTTDDQAAIESLADTALRAEYNPTSAKAREFLTHYFEKYAVPDSPPGWMILEVTSFGELIMILKLIKPEFVERVLDHFRGSIIATAFEPRTRITGEEFVNSLQAVQVIRNAIAHYNQLWCTHMNYRFVLRKHVARDFGISRINHTEYNFINFALTVALFVQNLPGAVTDRRCNFVTKLAELCEAYKQVIRPAELGIPEKASFENFFAGWQQTLPDYRSW